MFVDNTAQDSKPSVGDVFDPIAIGNAAIDIKKMMKDAGYEVPKASIDNITIPVDIQLEVDRLKVVQSRYDRLEYTAIACRYCEVVNSTHWRVDRLSGVEFTVCGNCGYVMEVR